VTFFYTFYAENLTSWFLTLLS